MGMESRKYERPGERAILELHFGPDPPEVADSPDLVEQASACGDVVVQASACRDDASAAAIGESADESCTGASVEASIEDEFETDPALVPAGASALAGRACRARPARG
jgi:hypothetical protein